MPRLGRAEFDLNADAICGERDRLRILCKTGCRGATAINSFGMFTPNDGVVGLLGFAMPISIDGSLENSISFEI